MLLQLSAEEKASCPFDEVFAFDRTVSRLLEMQSEPYNIAIQASLLQPGDQGCGYRHLMAACALAPLDSKVRALLPSMHPIDLSLTRPIDSTIVLRYEHSCL